MNAARNEVVPRPFRRARGQDRRLVFEKSLLQHAAPDARDHFRAQHDVAVNLVAAQIQKAVSQPLLFRNVLGAATWNGSTSAADSTSSRSATTSTRPVGSDGLMFSSVRAITLPDTLITLSSLTASAALNASDLA